MDTRPFENERILLTGGAGFIGSHLCERFLQEGAEVQVIDNFDAFYSPAIKRRNLAAVRRHARFTLTTGDIRNRKMLARAFAWQPTLLVHLAALAGVRPSIAAPDRYMEINVVGTARLLQHCAESGVKRVVFASSSSVYGNRKTVPFREHDPVDDPVSPYAASKKAGELLCHTYAHLYGLAISCLRFFTVYGPRQRPEMAIHKFVRAITTGEDITLFGDGSSSRDYTYIDDIVDGVVGAAQHLDGYQIFNLGESTPITLADLVETIEEVTGCSARRAHLPDQPGDVERTFADVERARTQLGYAPKVGIREGVERFFAWYQDNLK